MRQLRGQDAAFLYGDTQHANANVTLIHIYDQTTAPGGMVRFKSLLAHIGGRLHRAPLFRQRLLRVPFDLDRPYWVEDENFDLEYHVRHIALPQPGDWRQFCIQASRIHARPLDMSRPLWEVYVIERLDGFQDLPPGSFAVLTKVHHAAIDLEHGNEITSLLHDTTPEPPEPEPPEPWFPEAAPGSMALAGRAVVHNLLSPLRLTRPMVDVAARVWPVLVDLARDALFHPERLPITRFNAVVSPHRVFETRRFRVDEFDEICGLVDGASLNDAVLAVCAGGLRRYLLAHDELPSATLSAIAPVHMRPARSGRRRRGTTEAAIDFSLLRLPLGTDIEDEVERLRFVHEQASSIEAMRHAVDSEALSDLSQHAPAATLALTSKLIARTAATAGRRAPLAHCTITNVPGPGEPLYLSGARLTYFSAIMPILDGMGLVFAVTTYEDLVVVSPTSCRELMPDPAFFAQCVRDCFQDYLSLARARTRGSRRPARRVPKAQA